LQAEGGGRTLALNVFGDSLEFHVVVCLTRQPLVVSEPSMKESTPIGRLVVCLVILGLPLLLYLAWDWILPLGPLGLAIVVVALVIELFLIADVLEDLFPWLVDNFAKLILLLLGVWAVVGLWKKFGFKAAIVLIVVFGLILAYLSRKGNR